MLFNYKYCYRLDLIRIVLIESNSEQLYVVNKSLLLCVKTNDVETGMSTKPLSFPYIISYIYGYMESGINIYVLIQILHLIMC